jgi:mono/diheme cytochrome c family protein
MKATSAPTNSPRLLVYSLQGTAKLPPEPVAVTPLAPPESQSTQVQIKRGDTLFANFCSRCHGSGTISAGPLKDLKRSSRLGDAKQWNLVAYAGLLAQTGMPGFMAELKPDDVEVLRLYVIAQAHAAPEG